MKLEVCIESADDALIAVEAGADRLELNAALRLGGVSPSLGTLVEIRQLIGPQFPIVVMVRPREGDFRYSPREFGVMLHDADLFLEHGANGIAFGVLTRDGRVDQERCERLVEQVQASPGASEGAVFHRAFDFVADPLAAIDVLAALGVSRIMTSGQCATAGEGAGNIARYIAHAAGRVEILPAAGIRPENVEALIRATGCNQVHGSLREAVGTVGDHQAGKSTPVRLSSDTTGEDTPRTATSDRLVRAMVDKLRRYADLSLAANRT